MDIHTHGQTVRRQNGLAPENITATAFHAVALKNIPGRRSGTRQDDDLATSEFKSNIAKKTFRYRGANFWNSISKTGIQSIKETNIFGKLIKQNIISNY